MKFYRFAIIILLIFNVMILQAQKGESDLKHWPKGSSPAEIGKRIVVKFLNTPHSRYGNTHPDVPPTQITYPDVCAWLGGLWFAQVTNDKPMSSQLEARFNPLFDTQKNLLPKP
ncbi:MAG TPA: hypothetical protein VGK38_09100, partial [Prolixibacteraceae bacterium]